MIKINLKKVIPDLEGLLQSIKINLKSHSRSRRTFTIDQIKFKKVIPDLEVLFINDQN